MSKLDAVQHLGFTRFMKCLSWNLAILVDWLPLFLLRCPGLKAVSGDDLELWTSCRILGDNGVLWLILSHAAAMRPADVTTIKVKLQSIYISHLPSYKLRVRA